jgi:hypothetical protein
MGKAVSVMLTGYLFSDFLLLSDIKGEG